MLSLFENSRSVRNVSSGEIQNYQDPRLQPMDAVEEQPADWYEDCIHSGACLMQVCRFDPELNIDDSARIIASALGCGDDCEEYDEANRIPTSKCGVMRDAT